MTEKERIAQLEAQLETLQKEETGGKDPEQWAKAKQMARMSWMDVAFVLEQTGLGTLGEEDVKDLQSQLIERKYDYLMGTNKTALSWRN